MPKGVKIKPGDLVRIVAPAGKGSIGNLPLIKEYVESLGFVAKISENIYDQSEPFYSNFDEARAADLISAITDENCKIIWCIRGGTGSIRLIRYLEAQLPTETPSPKILIGYSDITVLHLYLSNKYNWKTIHGPMLEAIVNGFYEPDGESLSALKSLLFNAENLICEPTLSRLDCRGNIGTISTEIIGGNLTLVETSIGTKWEINPVGKILFLEDVGEVAYSLERSLDHLSQAGIFDSVAAVVFGDFTDPDDINLVNFVLQRFAHDDFITCPVFKLTGIGHDRVNFPLPLNTRAQIIPHSPESSLYSLCVLSIT